MYTEEIKYLSCDSDENTHINQIRNAYFENRSCYINVLDFLNQEVIIVPSSYFSYAQGPAHATADSYIEPCYEDKELNNRLEDTVHSNIYDGYHISVLDNYISIVAQNRRCIFTNKDMEEGGIIGTVFWVKNYNELIEEFGNENLKRISKAIVHPFYIEITECSQPQEYHCLTMDFMVSMEIYKPEIIFKYTIDSYMENTCLDVYTKLVKRNLNSLVDKYMQKYEKCDGYGVKGEQNYSTHLCACGRLRALCYLDL